MRLTISHETHYRYESPPDLVVEVLRLTPANTATQTVPAWRIDVTGDAALLRFEDAFGNTNHTFTLNAPGGDIRITATGTVETEPHNGVITGTRERLPLGVYRRETALTAISPRLRDLAVAARDASDGSPLAVAHCLNRMVHQAIRYDTEATDVATAAADAMEAGHGVCQDLAHVFIAAARAAGLPARYVAGYQYAPERGSDQHAGHAWAEVFVEGLGWVAFDPSAGVCPSDAHVRVAIGLDYVGAAPVRGAVYGGSGEKLRVQVTVEHAVWQSSNGGFSQAQSLQ
jgi:transglutaminase-like putative cysteine protease